nr:MAG TPA: hypothetical protein [Caudoviricetes sp.]
MYRIKNSDAQAQSDCNWLRRLSVPIGRTQARLVDSAFDLRVL